MSNIDKRALREAAEKATPGRVGDRIDGSGSIKYQCLGNDGSLVLQTDHKNMEYGFIGENSEADELFFRMCDPATVLALLDELEAVQKTSAARLGAIDTTHKMFQRERDRADAAEKRNSELSQKAEIYDMLREDYGLNGSLVDFVDWQAKRISELEEKQRLIDICQGQGLEHRIAAEKRAEAAEKRIAELEAREVKLPELKMLSDYLAEVTMREREDILVGVRLEFFRVLEEAGVKVAAAGKGE